MEENIRTYQFHVPGFIPGVPGNWPAGSKVTINEETKEVLGVSGLPTSMTQDELAELEPTLRFVEPASPPALPEQIQQPG